MRSLKHVIALIVIAMAAVAAEPSADELGRDLASPVYAKREAAGKALWALGAKARPVLEKIAAGDDAEARERAEGILEKFDWGLFPDTPAKISEQIEKARRGNATEQVEALQELLKMGSDGIAAAETILRHDFTADTRSSLAHLVDRSLARLVPEALLAGDTARVESLLLLGAMGIENGGAMDYAFYQSQWGHPDIAVKHLERLRRLGGQVGRQPAAALAILHHYAGRRTESRRLLDDHFKIDIETTLYESLLEEQGAWTDLAEIGTRGREVANSLGMNLFRERMAGRKNRVDDLWKELAAMKLADTATLTAVQHSAAAWSLNGKPLELMEHFRDKSAAKPILIDMIAAQLRFDESLKILVEPENDPKTSPRASARVTANVHLRRGRVLAQLGKNTEATAAFDQALRLNDDRTILRDLLRAEVRVGQIDKALQHTADYFDFEEKRNRDRDYYSSSFRPSPFEILFDLEGDAAQGWWLALSRAQPRPETVAVLRQVSRLLDGTATQDEVEAATSAMIAYRRNMATVENPYTIWNRVQAGRAMAAMHIARGRIALAENELRDAIMMLKPDPDSVSSFYNTCPKDWVYNTDESYRVWIDLGDLLLQQGRPHSAAEIYFAGWKHFPNNPVPLYHSGRALITAGQVKEGEHRISVAHQVPLADARMRGRFLDELLQRGRVQDIRRECDHVRNTVWRQYTGNGNVWNQLLRAHSLLREYDTAGIVVDRYCNYILASNGYNFSDSRSYLDLPMLVPMHKCLAAANAGRIPAAMALAREVLAAVPGHVQLTTTLVPELDRRGLKKEADEIFQTSWNAFLPVMRDYPQSAWAYASAAIIAANCSRELDAAIHHAKKAVALEPASKWHREVLAETHFRRGETKAAIAIMTKLIGESPRNHFHLRQLNRFEKGDVSSPQPLLPE